VTPHQLGLVAALTLALLVAWFLFAARLGRIGFYAVFAFAVTASVQLVGVYLVFASLIIRRWPRVRLRTCAFARCSRTQRVWLRTRWDLRSRRWPTCRRVPS